MTDLRTRNDEDSAAALRYRKARDEVFYARLEAASKPFGARDILICLGMALGIVVTASVISVVLNWLTR